MSFFTDVLYRRVWMYLVVPLLVGGTLLWQRQPSVGPAARSTATMNALSGGPPSGVSTDEWETARVEFQGLTDSTFQCGTEEMPAYWRLLKWSVRQAGDETEQNQFSRVAFNDLVNRPSALRGTPVQVDLHVCRIVSYAAPENSLGIERLYEVWGWSDNSHGSLYVAITPDLPAGMQTGESVSERATLCGYFYKIQGYLAAGSASQTALSTAPLLIGRMTRWQTPVAVLANTTDLWFSAAGLMLAGSFAWLLCRGSLFRFRYDHALEQVAPNGTTRLETWLDSQPVAGSIGHDTVLL